MSTVSVDDLSRHTSKVLSRVQRGQEVEITDSHDKAVARIVPSDAHPLNELIASGDLRPPLLSGPIPAPSGPVRTTHEAGALLEQMRDEERY